MPGMSPLREREREGRERREGWWGFWDSRGTGSTGQYREKTEEKKRGVVMLGDNVSSLSFEFSTQAIKVKTSK